MGDLSESQHRLSRAISEATNGTLSGPDQLIQAFYPELKRMAAAKMRGEAQGHTWQPTELVNELYLELIRVNALRSVQEKDPRQKSAFFALAAQVMRWLLIRHTRRLSWKVEMQELPASLADASFGACRLAELDDLLARLAVIDLQLRAVVELRVFEGLSIEETAACLGCSVSTVTRNWRYAKAWLQSQLASEPDKRNAN